MSSSSPHYFSRQPATPSHRRTIRLSLPDLELGLTTDRGVFSTDRIDPGTRLLLQEAPAPTAETATALDLGCGYGPIAVALSRRAPSIDVWAVDVNERAVALCAENAEAAGAARVHPVVVDEHGAAVAGAPDDLAGLDAVRFGGIWSNPPIRIGKPALHRMLTTWLDRLRPDGRAWLVVQRHLGADSLAAWMEGEGWATERLVSRAGYRLLEVRPR
ncbi:MAG TPA: methyltransferase [Acidimicrobiales bacterium]